MGEKHLQGIASRKSVFPFHPGAWYASFAFFYACAENLIVFYTSVEKLGFRKVLWLHPCVITVCLVCLPERRRDGPESGKLADRAEHNIFRLPPTSWRSVGGHPQCVVFREPSGTAESVKETPLVDDATDCNEAHLSCTCSGLPC